MKKILLSLVAVATISLSALGQAPEGFKYQAVVRDAGNLILNNQAVGMRLTIQQGSIGGVTVYSETFSITTNTYGLVNLEIGTGTTAYDFSTIDWGNGPYFMETAVDVTGGTSYAVMGTSQLMSVPYALHSKTSENVTNDLVDDADADPTNELQDWSNLPGIPAGLSDGTDDVDDADADPTNELQDWSNLPGIPAGLSDGIDNVDDADADPTNELQDWSNLPGIPAELADGTDDVDDADADSTNELQTISLSNDTLYLSKGGEVYIGDLGGVPGSVEGIPNGQRYKEFNFIGVRDTFIVPSNIYQLKIECFGASGGGFAGLGGYIGVNYRCTPGDLLFIYVGGTNGYNGGGNDPFNNSNNGGGMSDVRSSTFFSDVIVVAGGGGAGSNNSYRGGDGGTNQVAYYGAGGQAGTFSNNNCSGNDGGMSGGAANYCNAGTCVGAFTVGGGGGLTSGGSSACTSSCSGCSDPTSCGTTTDGSFGLGGDGKYGGGGGYYGGGSADSPCGTAVAAGGGSSFADPNLCEFPMQLYGGVNQGNGKVVISW